MSKFCFSVTNLETRHEGIVESESFKDAVSALGKHVSVRRGDLLEIGVNGFPPARFECVGAIGDGQPMWMPANKLAA
jgi:hypothetical protein